jgi:homoserine kinase
MQKIQVFAPASVANVSCGFDVLGFAVHRPGDMVEMVLNDGATVSLDHVEGDEGRLPRETEQNIASAVVINFLKYLGKTQGVGMKLFKQMPFGSGLGSSSASAVAGLVAINELMGNPLTREELLPFAMEGERLASGNAHADNVAPALLGGLVLIRSYEPLDVIRLPYPDSLCAALVYPHVEIPTMAARKIIKSSIPMKNAIRQWGNVAGLVAGFTTNNMELIGRSMEDVIVEPIRAMLIPMFYEMRELAMENNALGFGISGSGPTVFALCDNENTAKHITETLHDLLENAGLESTTYVSGINKEGPVVLRNEE